MNEPTKISERTLIRTQAVSGLVFATFLVLHLVNSMTSLAGQSTFDGTMRAVRHYYQFPLVEVAIIGAAFVHMWAGVARMLRRRKHLKERGAGAPPSLRVRLHRLTGYYMLLAFTGHVIATRGPGLLFDLPADMSFLNYSLTYYGWFFYPYYVGLFVSGAFHLTNGVLLALRMLEVRVPKWTLEAHSMPFWVLAGVMVVMGTLTILAIGGNFYEVDTARFVKYDELTMRLLGFAPGAK